MAPADGRSDRGAGCGAEEAAANGALRRVNAKAAFDGDVWQWHQDC